MPTYTFFNETTGEEQNEFMSFTVLDEFVKSNPHLIQRVGSPAIVSGRGMGKPTDSFRDILRNIKKEHSRGLTGATVNTF